MRIKINTNNIARKLSAISCKLSAFRNLKPRLIGGQATTPPHRRASYNPTSSAGKLQPSPRNLQPTTCNPTSSAGKLQPNRGFTLVELLVTLSLFVVLTTIVLFSQQKFNGSILLTNLAYDVALTVRQAQTYGINVREVSPDVFDKAYGVHFDTSSAKNKKFLLFSDSVGGGNGTYNGSWTCNGGGDECLNSYSIKRGNYISDIRIINSDTGCSSTDGGCSVNQLDITFLRPDPDAIFRSTPTKSNITEAKIIISSADGSNSRNVLVNSTGQISIGRGSGATCSTIGVLGVTETFNYKGFSECYQVPVGASSVTITAYGAQGGSVYGISGGLGGMTSSTFSVSEGDVLSVYVGGEGVGTTSMGPGAGGWNGGASGGQGGGGYIGGGGGGGASDVRRGSSIIIVAGGGGGAGGVGNSGDKGAGGGGGGGDSGVDGGNKTTASNGGAGGSQFFPGNGGTVLGGLYIGCAGGDGVLGAGGNGGCGSGGGGGGGGGGYNGGGGGGGGSGWGSPGGGGAGGGGGSGFGGSTTSGYQLGNGRVEINAY